MEDTDMDGVLEAACVAIADWGFKEECEVDEEGRCHQLESKVYDMLALPECSWAAGR